MRLTDMDAEGIKLEIVSPEATLVSCEVSSVRLPGSAGSFAVLKDHAPLISSLESGRVEYTGPEGTKFLDIVSGFVEVRDNRVSVCVEL